MSQLRGSSIRAAIAFTIAGALARSGGASGSTSTTGPSPMTVTVNIVGSSGNQAYTPNPVQAVMGATVVWKNYTADKHHIVMDDESADFGEIAPER